MGVQLGKQRYRPPVYLFSSPAELIFVIQQNKQQQGEHICDGATQSEQGEGGYLGENRKQIKSIEETKATHRHL